MFDIIHPVFQTGKGNRHEEGPSSRAAQRRTEDHRSPSSRGRSRQGRRTRHPHRPDPHAGRDRHNGVSAVRVHGRSPRAQRARRQLRGPQHRADRLRERGRPRLSPVRRQEVRHRLLEMRQRHLPPAASRTFRRARQDAPRQRFAHADRRRHRNARHRRRRNRHRRRNGGRGVPHTNAQSARRQADGTPSKGMQRKGHNPEGAGKVRHERQRRLDIRILRSGRQDARRAEPRHHREHGRGTGRHHERVPERRRYAAVPGRAGTRQGLERTRDGQGRAV